MDFPRKIFENVAFKTKGKIEKHMLIVTDKSIHEHLSHPLQFIKKQFKIAVTFLTGNIAISNVTNKNNKFYFPVSNVDDHFNVISISPGAYEIENLTNEIKRNIFGEGFFTGGNYPFTLKLIFSTLGSFLELSSNITGSQIGFTPDSIGGSLGFKPKVIHEEHTSSDYPVDVLSFANVFINTIFARGMVFEGKRSWIIHKFTMDVDPGYKFIEKLRGGIQW